MTSVEMTRDRMVAIEERSRRDLEAVSLVAELDLDVFSTEFVEAYEVVTAVVARNGSAGIEILGRNYPACTAICLATLGMQYGDGGEFWSALYENSGNTHQLPLLNPQRQAAYGSSFLVALEKLGLPRFAHITDGRRYLTPILLHAGLPASGVGRVWKALAHQIERGYEDGREIVGIWRREPDDGQRFTKPVSRFVRETGRFASDLLRRMTSVLIEECEAGELLPSAEIALKHRIPRIFVERLREEDVGRLQRREMMPRPFVFVDTLSDVGPQLHLPTIPRDVLNSTWRVTDALDETKTYQTSAQRTQEPVLTPSNHWACELVNDDGFALSPLREFLSFGGKSLWFFRESQRGLELYEPEGTLDSGRVVVLVRRTCRVLVENDGEIVQWQPSENFPELAGKWSKFALFDGVVSENDLFRVENSASGEEDESSFLIELQVVAPPVAPMLSGDTCAFASDLTGRHPFTGVPKVVFSQACPNPGQYSLILNHATTQLTRTRLDTVRNDGITFFLDEVISWRPGTYTLRVLGPLGSDLVEQFTYLPDFQIVTGVSTSGPYGLVKSTVQIRDFEPVDVVFPEGQSRIQEIISVPGEELLISMEIRRVLFDVLHERGELPRLGAVLANWTDEQFFGSSGAEIVLKFPEACSFNVLLKGEVDFATHRRSSQADGFSRIDLADFSDDVRGLRSILIKVLVECPSLGVAEFPVLEIRTKVRAEFREVRVLETSPDDRTFEISVGKLTDTYAVEVTAKNLDMPWLEAQVLTIPSTSGTALVVTPEEFSLPPGRYELSAYPSGNRIGQSLDTTEVRVGTYQDVRTYVAGLPEVGKDIAIRATFGHVPPRRISKQDFLDGLPIVGEFLISHFLDERYTSLVKKTSRTYFFNDEFDSERFEWMGKEFSLVGKNDIERLIVALYPDLVDTPSEKISAEQGLRLWRASPLLGAAVTYPSRDPEIVAMRQRVLGNLAVTKQDVGRMANESFSLLSLQATTDFEAAYLLSNGYLRRALARFFLTASNESDAIARRFDDVTKREIMTLSRPLTEKNARLVNLLRVRGQVKSPWAPIPAQIQRLASVIIEPQPRAVADKAARQLAEATTFARPLVRWCILAALYQTRMSNHVPTQST